MATKKKKARRPAKPKAERVLLMRTTGPNGEAYGDFVWPLKVGAKVECQDWNPAPRCGGGLHGLLWGCGTAARLSTYSDARWLVIEADAADVVEITEDGEVKAKCRRCVVVHVGDRDSATSYIYARRPGPIVYGTATAGDGGTATAGDGGTATAGEGGTATAGYRGTATAGDLGTATAGDLGTATAGDRGTATAGYRGTATAGEGGTATAGYRGTATAGEGGTISVRHWDRAGGRYRIKSADVGENGFLPSVPYSIDEETGQLRINQDAVNAIVAGLLAFGGGK